MKYEIKELKLTEIKPDKNQPRKSFDEDKLNDVEISLKKVFCDGTIYSAISQINRYGKKQGVYIRSKPEGCIDETNKRKIEFRYFIPIELGDINEEKINLESRKEMITLKEIHLEHHKDITIPQEQRLAEIQR